MTTNMFRRRASINSTLCAGMADEMTTTSGPSRLAARWPMATLIPAFSSRVTYREGFRSDPVIR